MKKAIFPTATNNADTQQGTEPESKDSADESARKLAPASQVSGFAKAPPDNGSSQYSISDSSAESKARKKASSTEPDSRPAAKPATGKAKSSSSDQSSDVGPSIRKKVANRQPVELSDSSDKSHSILQKKMSESEYGKEAAAPKCSGQELL